MSRILVSDDDLPTCDFFRELLDGLAEEIVTCGDPKETIRLATNNVFDVLITDLNFEQLLSGIDILRRVKEVQPSTEVVLISAFGSLDTAVAAVREGAFDFISKPFNVEEVKSVVRRALHKRVSAADLPREAQGADGAEPILVGSTAEMLRVYKMIAYVADSTTSVLVQGESGTGKELVARAIHEKGPRSHMPFVAVNCGALTETLLESELFGHTKGAFTGAGSDKQGLLQAADKGTLFLDEISETSASLQVKLLRVLQEGEYKPVGSTRTLTSDARIIAVTNHDLEKLVEEGRFREDLFYRLNVVTIRVPALRQRREDIPRLIAHFVSRLVAQGQRELKFTAKALDRLVRYSWPGNVRELENVIERLSLFFRGREITPEDLPERFREKTHSALENLCEDMPSLEEVERRYVLEVLRHTEGNRKRAAEILKIDRRTLYRMLHRFGVRTGGEKAHTPESS